MIDLKDRFKFQWLDPQSAADREVRTGIRVVVVGAFLLFAVLALWLLRSPKPLPPQEVKAEEELLTVPMNADVLIDALEERAADWCDVSSAANGDLLLSNVDDDDARRHFDRIMLRDSLAPVMADEYSHLFQWDDDGDVRSFQMVGQEGAVFVPVWLVKALVDDGVLTIP